MNFKIRKRSITISSLVAAVMAALMAPHIGMAKPSEAASQELIQQIEAAGGITIPDLVPAPEAFQVIPPNTKIKGRGGLSAKVLDLPENLRKEIAIAVPIGEDIVLSDDEIGWQMISSIRYRGEGKTIFVTVVKPTRLAKQYTRSLARIEKLADGSEAEAIEDCSRPAPGREPVSCSAPNSETPNQLIFKQGQLLVSIASNLSIDEIKGLVSRLKDAN